ncbi:PREDICTED: pentatricopeptide repeat-containing protein At5g27460 [Tarenaya hassleriana]|uniref:pentatricopeptide repeat-containing protein At5g27460 n=1 Tax=Tarenaya hassleriana TaxID=28532 RepID=UPI00053C7985|nr:PREDICTED: pentatricopeptide repeat-containing protein At5g27460 [Tarenaya hassleriana]
MVTSRYMHGFRWATKTTSLSFMRLVSSRASPGLENSSTGSDCPKTGVREILRRITRRGSISAPLQEWVDSGRVVSVSELRSISKQLMRSERYDLALEMMEWMEETLKGVQVSSYDHALRMESIIKVRGLKKAEEYFDQLHETAPLKVVKAAYLPLLRAYVKEKFVHESEALMKKLNGLGLLVDPHPFNEMMKLYAATSQIEKVPLVIMQMKRNKIPRNVLSYNLWMNACGEVYGVASVEAVYREMVSDKSVEVGWSTLCTLANVYMKTGFDEKATLVLENAEKKLNNNNRLGYFFLITLYASLRNKEGVVRLWEASKSVHGRITCANYICVLSSLVKVGDRTRAERIFGEWEANCRNYDVRVSNVLLGAYARKGLMEKGESFHARVLRRGGEPNYKTWEILIEGWVKCQDMTKAIDAMSKAFDLMKRCHWRPPQKLVMSIAEYFEKHEKLEEANAYARQLRCFGLSSLELYRLLLRMHAKAGKPSFYIVEMMRTDKIDVDDETYSLTQAHN